MKKGIFIITLILISVLSTNVYGSLKKADKLFNLFQYSKALPLYKKTFEKKNTVYTAVRVAECYSKNNDSKNSEIWYVKALNIGDFENSESYLNYGQVLKNNGKYDLAKTQFEQFKTLKPEDNRGELYANSCDVVKKWLTVTDVFKVNNVASLNTKKTEFSPVYYKKGLVITTNRRVNLQENYIYGWTGAHFLNLLYTVKDSSEIKFSGAKGLDNNINHDYHDGPATFAKNQKFIAFTKVFKETTGGNFINRKKIFFAQKNDVGDWGKVTPFYLNSDEYSVDHPSLTESGDTLFFASDMPGGFGNADIYFCTKTDTGWSKPINMGSTVNTFANEMFPYIHSSGTLYFSSNGHIGYGGLDIYSADIANNSYKVSNLRSPINSSADDFGIILNEDKTEGYLSSNRFEGLGEDDIYHFSPADPIEAPIECNEIVKKDLCVEFSLDGEINENLIYNWDMGDGNTVTGENVNYCYTYNGIFKVVLNTTDKRSGKTKNNEQTVDIDVTNNHNSVIVCKDTVNKGEVLNLNAEYSKIEGYDVIEYNWLIDGNSSKKGANANDIILTSGIHDIGLQLKGINSNGKDTVSCSSKKVYVIPNKAEQDSIDNAINEALIASNKLADSLNGFISNGKVNINESNCLKIVKEDLCVSLTASGDINPNLEYIWTMGDGTTLKGLNINHCYNYNGIFNLELVTKDKRTGNVTKAETMELDVINNHEAIIVSKDTVYINEPVVFNGTNSENINPKITTYSWYLNNEQIGYKSKITKRFNEIGSNRIALKINKSDGSSSCSYKDIVVKSINIEAADDYAYLLTNTTKMIDLFANDNQNKDLNTNVIITNQANNGKVNYLGGGIAEYKPNTNFYGKDTAHYKLYYVNGADKDSALIYFTVKDTNVIVAIKDSINYLKNNYNINITDLESMTQNQLDSIYNKYESDELAKANDNDSKFKDIIVLRNVFFDFDKYDLREESKDELDKLYTYLKNNPDVKTEIAGHTDAMGNNNYNINLSKKRAQAIVNYQIKKGISKNRLIAKGYGETEPIARNTNPDGTDNPAGRQINRRIELRILKSDNTVVDVVEPVKVDENLQLTNTPYDTKVDENKQRNDFNYKVKYNNETIELKPTYLINGVPADSLDKIIFPVPNSETNRLTESYYTIQLMALTNEYNLKNVLNKYAHLNDLWVYKIDGYIKLYTGTYKTKEEAVKFKDELQKGKIGYFVSILPLKAEKVVK